MISFNGEKYRWFTCIITILMKIYSLNFCSNTWNEKVIYECVQLHSTYIYAWMRSHKRWIWIKWTASDTNICLRTGLSDCRDIFRCENTHLHVWKSFYNVSKLWRGRKCWKRGCICINVYLTVIYFVGFDQEEFITFVGL